MKIVVNSWPF